MSPLIVVFFISALLFSKVSSVSKCLTYDFEENIDEFLINENCQPGFGTWITDSFGEFESPFSPQSKTFISPGVEMSCASSNRFSIDTSGTFEINVVMMPSDNAVVDLIVVQIMSVVNNSPVGSASLSMSDAVSPGGYQIMTINWAEDIEPGIYEIYVVFLGMAAEDSRVLVDSLRYIAPELNPDVEECLIYNDTTEPSTTEPSTTEPSTTEPSTTEPSTTEPSPTEPSTTEPSTTEPSTTEPNTTEPNTTEPSTTEPSTIEPSTTEPSTTEPSTTEPSTIEPSTTELSTTEPTTTEPSTTEPNTTEPSTTEPSTIEPSTTEPSTTEPSTTKPSTTEPSTTEPSTTEPSTTEPSTTEPNTTGPSTTEPSTTEPSTTEPNINSSTTETSTENFSTKDPISTSEPNTENQSTNNPIFPEESDDTFWMTLALVSISLLGFTIMAAISWTFYRCGQRRMLSQLQQNFSSTDIDNLPKPIQMPRARFYNNYYKNDKFKV